MIGGGPLFESPTDKLWQQGSFTAAPDTGLFKEPCRLGQDKLDVINERLHSLVASRDLKNGEGLKLKVC